MDKTPQASVLTPRSSANSALPAYRGSRPGPASSMTGVSWPVQPSLFDERELPLPSAPPRGPTLASGAPDSPAVEGVQDTAHQQRVYPSVDALDAQRATGAAGPAAAGSDSDGAHDGDPADNTRAKDNAAHAQHWLQNPRAAFEAWKRSQPLRPQSHRSLDDQSLTQYLSMWGSFVRWMDSRAPLPALPAAGRTAPKPLDLRDITPSHIQGFLAQLRGGRRGDRPMGASSERRYLFLLHRTFEHVRALELRADNPCDAFPQLQPVHAAARPPRVLLSAPQEYRFIQWCLAQPTQRWDHCRNLALRLLLLGAGLTVSELRGLRLRDIVVEDEGSGAAMPLCQGPHLAADSTDISNLEDAALPRLSLSIPEHGSAAARRAPVDTFATRALLQWLRARALLQPAGELVFNARRMDGLGGSFGCAAGAHALSAKEVYDIVAEALQAVGFAGARQGPATLRNTFMARHIRTGTPLAVLRDWTGLRTTQQLVLLQRQVPYRIQALDEQAA